MNLRDQFIRVLNEYDEMYKKVWTTQVFRDPLIDFFNSSLKEDIQSVVGKFDSSLLVDTSTGVGRVTGTPWIAVMDPRVTKKASQGIYVVYLFNKDKKVLYLTLEGSITEANKTVEEKGFSGREKTNEVNKYLQENKAKILASIDTKDFNSDTDIDSGKKDFDIPAIIYKKYELSDFPSEQDLILDLENILAIYNDYVKCFVTESKDDVEQKEGEEFMTDKEKLEIIKNYISSQGFTFDDGLIENYYLSLKSKPFVILAGTSGTGKTRLVRLFAEAIGATTQNGRYKLVPVRPDWSDSSDLFGHVDLNGKFIPGVIIDFVKKAEEDIKNPYFLCMDEMNLARVEYYLSDILSVIETREIIDGQVITDPLVSENYYGADIKAAGKYGTLRIPENLYIIGTVNMDETTFPFSRKVLDRANTLEFSTVDLNADFYIGEAVPALQLDNYFMKSEYVFFNQCNDHVQLVKDVCSNLQKMNEILKTANAHVGYRVRDEIVFYMINNANASLLKENDAFDNEIMQKILPRIQGSSASVKNMLCELFKFCAGDYEGYQTENDDISSKMLKAAKKENCKYGKSAQKIAYMVRRYEEDGFTAYWL